MNTWQCLRQLRYLLLARTWAGTGSVVFGSGAVHVSAMPTEKAKPFIRPPLCLLWPGSMRVDPEYGEEPDLLIQEVNASLMTVAPGDHVGQKPMIGGNVPDRTKSEGRGILEIEEEFFAAIEKLSTDTGIVIQNRTSGGSDPSYDPDFGYIVSRNYQLELVVTADRFYHPCANLVATGGSGSVSLSWSNPPDRYDRYRVVLRRASGTTAPTSVSGGTGVTLSGNLATSVTDSGLAAGTYSYALFAQFDETNATASQADRTSDSVTRTSVTVT